MPIAFLSLIPLVAIGLWVAAAIFTFLMLVDCLNRDWTTFKPIFTPTGEQDKLIWAILIVAGFFFFHIGAIAYYVVVKRSSTPSSQTLPRLICLRCQRMLEPDWKACPHCGTEVPSLDPLPPGTRPVSPHR